VSYDAILLVSFGGPERPEDVMPFLENVLRGRNVPRERMLEVAGHYRHFGGRSPINRQCRELIAALAPHASLPVYWGNRNWHPMLAGTVRRMAEMGVKRALAIATSAFSSYSGCRQYLEDIEAARAEAGANAPEIDKLPPFGLQAGYLEANADRVRDALERIPAERRADARLVFTAHSIPSAMADRCRYEVEFREAAALVTGLVGHSQHAVAWQSRSGAPGQPWLEPGILEWLKKSAAEGVRDVLISPLGFMSDHMEVIYDLDYEAAALCQALGIGYTRAQTAGTHPALIGMLAESIRARQAGTDCSRCAADCCPAPARPVGILRPGANPAVAAAELGTESARPRGGPRSSAVELSRPGQ
jgi:protoporphyrin/coproporphyrin ferrochelatase